MTYNVFGGTLNLAQSINSTIVCIFLMMCLSVWVAVSVVQCVRAIQTVTGPSLHRVAGILITLFVFHFCLILYL